MFELERGCKIHNPRHFSARGAIFHRPHSNCFCALCSWVIFVARIAATKVDGNARAFVVLKVITNLFVGITEHVKLALIRVRLVFKGIGACASQLHGPCHDCVRVVHTFAARAAKIFNEVGKIGGCRRVWDACRATFVGVDVCFYL